MLSWFELMSRFDLGRQPLNESKTSLPCQPDLCRGWRTSARGSAKLRTYNMRSSLSTLIHTLSAPVVV